MSLIIGYIIDKTTETKGSPTICNLMSRL